MRLKWDVKSYGLVLTKTRILQEKKNFNIEIILNILICCYYIYIFICIKASKLSENLQNNSQRKGGFKIDNDKNEHIGIKD